MPINIFQRFLLGVAACLAAPCFAGPLVDSQMGQILNLKDAHKITLLDMYGKAVTEEQFMALPGSFNVEKHKNADGTIDMVLRRNDPNEKPKPAAAPVALKVGDTLPEFALKGLDGQIVNSKSLRGRYSVLSFYFAECGPCIHEVPQLNALAKAHPDMGFLALTFDSMGDAKAFVQKRKLEWPVLAEADIYIKSLKVKSYPLLLVVGPDAKVVAVRSGMNEHAPQILPWVDDVLAKSR
jgi:thiol-disulfide isomerase/thioredoxin